MRLIGRARLYLEFRELFKTKLREEVRKFVKLCKRTGRIPAIRLNVSSDIVWEKIFPELFAEFPEVRWYDYSKALPKHRPILPANYTVALVLRKDYVFRRGVYFCGWSEYHRGI